MNNSQNETLLLDDNDTDTDNSLNGSHHSGNLISAAAADDISINGKISSPFFLLLYGNTNKVMTFLK